MSLPDVVWLEWDINDDGGTDLLEHSEPAWGASCYIRRTDDDIAEARRLVEAYHKWGLYRDLATFIEQRYLGGGDE